MRFQRDRQHARTVGADATGESSLPRRRPSLRPAIEALEGRLLLDAAESTLYVPEPPPKPVAAEVDASDPGVENSSGSSELPPYAMLLTFHDGNVGVLQPGSLEGLPWPDGGAVMALIRDRPWFDDLEPSLASSRPTPPAFVGPVALPASGIAAASEGTTIVWERDGDNDSSLTGQILPSFASTMVLGSMRGEDRTDFYQVQVASSVSSVHIQLGRIGPQLSAASVIAVFDSEGNELGRRPLFGDGPITEMDLSEFLKAAGPHLNIGIIRPAFSDDAEADTMAGGVGDFYPADPGNSGGEFGHGAGANQGLLADYFMHVDVHSDSTLNVPPDPVSPTIPGLPEAPKGGNTTAPSGLITPSTPPSDTSGVSSQVPQQLTDSATLAIVLGPQPAMTGPLPALAAAPMGGAFGDGSPTRAIDARETVRVDLALVALGQDSGGDAEVVEGSPDALGDVDDLCDQDAGLSSIRGTGGFPLLASGRAGGRGRDNGSPRIDLIAESTIEQSTTESDPGQVAPAEAETHRAIEGVHRRHGLVRRVSALIGLQAAATLSFGLMFPDLGEHLRVLRLRRLVRRRTRPAEA
ncbi:hypothetical protein EP7_002097 [Isosphaeraceae bacterium EP7]